AAADDGVVGAPLDEQVAVRIEPAPVPGGEPAVRVQRAPLSVLPGDLLTADEHQAGLPRARRLRRGPGSRSRAAPGPRTRAGPVPPGRLTSAPRGGPQATARRPRTPSP